MSGEGPGLTKIEAAERQLEAAFFLLLHDFFPEAIHTLIGASRGILYGLAKQNPNDVLGKWDRTVLSRIAGADTRSIRRYQNRVANFLKHAENDPHETLVGIDLKALNETELQLCIIAIAVLQQQVSKRLNWALWFLSLAPNAIIPFNVIAEEYLGSVEPSDLARMQDREAFRGALLQLYQN